MFTSYYFSCLIKSEVYVDDIDQIIFHILRSHLALNKTINFIQNSQIYVNIAHYPSTQCQG